MGFLKNIFGGSGTDKRLLGNWISDPNDQTTIEFAGDVTMVFDETGNLTYLIKENDKIQIIKMTYVIKGNILITDQPSHPKKEETNFYFEDDDTLILKFDGMEGRYKRENKLP